MSKTYHEGEYSVIMPNLFELVRQHPETERYRDRQLTEQAHQWEHSIRKALRQLAGPLWTGRRLLGFIPLRDYRIRQQRESQDYIWWVEHDIPPYDLYRCEAYLVRLALDDRGNPLISVHSGAETYSVQEVSNEMIQELVAIAGEDPPLIIPRRMDPAMD